MRLAILADVHANLAALEAVLDDAGRIGVDGIAVAGDLTGGPQPLETIRLLRAAGCWLIQGNAEEYLIACQANGAEIWRRSHQWASTDWTYRRLDRETLAFIASLPVQRTLALDGCAPIRIVHGSPHASQKHLFPDRDLARLCLYRQAGMLAPDQEPPRLAPVLAQIEEPVLVCGHSHIQWQQAEDGKLALNPGSVGSPIGEGVRAQYAVLSWEGERWRVEHRAVPYDLARTCAAFRESGLLAKGGAFARAILLGVETGLNVCGDLVAYAYRLAAVKGVPAGRALPDAIWDEAVVTFDWEAAARGGRQLPR